jgi:hypothetical protein
MIKVTQAATWIHDRRRGFAAARQSFWISPLQRHQSDWGPAKHPEDSQNKLWKLREQRGCRVTIGRQFQLGA